MFEKLAYIIKWGENEVYIENAPKEWDEGSLKWSRSTTYWGLTREFSLPNEFVGDGANILRSIFYNGNSESKATLEIRRHRGLSQGYTVEYEGEFDFSTFKDFGDSVEIDLADNGIEKDIKANESVDYEINQTDSDCFVRIGNIDESRRAIGNILSDTQNQLYYFMVPSVIIANTDQMQTNIVEVQSITENTYTNVAALMTESNWVLKGKSSTPINLVIDLYVSRVASQGGFFNDIPMMMLVDEDRNIIFNRYIYENGHHKYELTRTLIPNKRYYLFFSQSEEMSSPVRVIMPLILEQSNISISYDRGSTVFDVPAIKASTLFHLLVQKMRGVFTETNSDLLKRLDNLKITCGDWIRYAGNERITNPVMVTNFKDFFQSMRAALGACFGVDGDVCRIEGYDYFFNNQLYIANVGDATDIEIGVFKEILHPDIKAGYKNQTYDTELGRLEFNSEQQYSTLLSRSSGSLNLQSPYRADHFGIDKIRQDVENANLTETDKEADKDVWMIWTKKNALTSNIYEAEKASDFDSYSGIESQANMINLEISPKRNMLRNGSFLRAMAYGTSGILFESGKKNTELRSNKNGDNVVESAPILVNDIPNPLLFIPITVKLTAPITYSTFRQLKGKNKGYIEFRYNNNVFKGFVLDVEANIAYTEVIELNLLLHPDTDLNNFLYL